MDFKRGYFSVGISSSIYRRKTSYYLDDEVSNDFIASSIFFSFSWS
ncbi:hypothetical protein ACMBCN_03595 [Candidatus Liberibacter asiaticus]